MRKINLKEEIKGFDGKAVMLGDEALTVKTILIQYLGTFASENTSEMIIAYAIGQNIYESKNSVLVSSSEFRLIEKALEKPQHGAVVYVPFKNAIDGSKEVDKK